MVVLNRIYTRTGDDGTTGLATGERRKKFDLRIEAYGTVDETNACIGLARVHTGHDLAIDDMLARIQNDLFDLGADLATPEGKPLRTEPLRIVEAQVERLEREIDGFNEDLAALALVRAAGRDAGRGGAPSCPHRLPPGRAPRCRPGRDAGGNGLSGRSQIPEPPVRLPVRGLARRERSRQS